ncbi:MAG: HAD family hydrolase, partial [Paracoccaceae bacterium]|nr:HAD family hydrolase [Paracoccaceae bacterium]
MITGILFDKDGTLFDFQATWGAWTRALLDELSDGVAARAAALGAAVGFEVEGGRFSPDSPIITHTPAEIAMALLPLLPGKSLAALVSQMNTMSAAVALAPAVPLAPFLGMLRGRGLRLGVATNDAESAARAQLVSAGIAPLFDFVAGFDSGHGGKPAPGMLLAFATAFDLAPEQVLMVGDSRHDLIAGRAAGMRVV